MKEKQFRNLNKERHGLIQKRLESGLTLPEELRLDELNKLADEYLDENSPFDLSVIEDIARKFGIDIRGTKK